MKKIFTIIFSFIILFSCSTKSQDELIDNKFEECYNNQIDELIKEYSFDKKKEPIERDIYSNYEKFLIRKTILTKNDKIGYINLLKKIETGEISKGYSDKFSEELNLETSYYFTPFRILSCHEQLYRVEKLIDKKSWQIKTALEINHFNASGNENINNLINAVKTIPDDKFDKIYYRDLIIIHIYNLLK